MKSLSSIKFHPFFFIVVIITTITGHFKDILIITSNILTHELGHVITGYLLSWKIEKIVILPFGGVTIFKEDINRCLLDEFLILISGPLLQFIVFYYFKNELVFNYNYAILLFNLLPIYPLDGSKLINIVLNKVFSFRKSLKLTLILSLISLVIFLSYNFNLITFIILLFPLMETIKTIRNVNYIFSKFLLERYQKKYHFKKVKIIKKMSEMKRDYEHIIIIDKKPYKEIEFLTKMFDFKNGL